MSNFIPSPGLILVRPRVQEKFTPSGLLIPDSVKKTQNSEGEIVASTAKAYAVGEVVVFGPYAGDEITVDDEKLLLLRVDDKTNEVWGKYERS